RPACLPYADALIKADPKLLSSPEAGRVFALVCEDDADACQRIGAALAQEGSPAALERACSLDHARACWTLAQQLRDGQTAEKDEPRANRLSQTACMLGVSDACVD